MQVLDRDWRQRTELQYCSQFIPLPCANAGCRSASRPIDITKAIANTRSILALPHGMHCPEQMIDRFKLFVTRQIRHVGCGSKASTLGRAARASMSASLQAIVFGLGSKRREVPCVDEHRRSARRYATVWEMREGPSRPAVRFWSQATASCCGQKPRW